MTMSTDESIRLEALKIAAAGRFPVTQHHVANIITVADKYEDFINNGKKPEEKE